MLPESRQTSTRCAWNLHTSILRTLAKHMKREERYWDRRTACGRQVCHNEARAEKERNARLPLGLFPLAVKVWAIVNVPQVRMNIRLGHDRK